MRIIWALGALLTFALPGAALADTTLHFALQKSDGGVQSTVYVRPGEVRSNNSRGTWMLYKASQKTLYVVQPARKTYIRVDPQTIKRLGKRIAEARKRYRAALKKMPPKERARIEKSMGPLLRDPSGRKPLTLHTGGSSGSVAGFACRSGEILQGGHVLQRLCIASPRALGMGAKEYAALKGLYGLMAKLGEATGFGPGPMPDLGRLNGVPIRLRSSGGNQSQRLTAVSHKALPDSLFTLPPGYSQARSFK